MFTRCIVLFSLVAAIGLASCAKSSCGMDSHHQYNKKMKKIRSNPGFNMG